MTVSEAHDRQSLGHRRRREPDDAYYLVEEEGGWREVSLAEAAQAVNEIAHGLLALGVLQSAFRILARTRLEWSLFDFALAHVDAKAAITVFNLTSRDTSSRTPRRSASSSRAKMTLQPLIEEARGLPALKHVLTFADLDSLREQGASTLRSARTPWPKRRPRSRRRPRHPHLPRGRNRPRRVA